MNDFCQNTLVPIGYVKSSLFNIGDAPNQGYEGAPDAWIEINDHFSDGLKGIVVGENIILLTWFHQSKRGVLEVHPQNNMNNPLTGVFATRSPDRPNPIGLHHVNLLVISGNKIKVGPLEAIDGTPVIDIKPVLSATADF